MVMEITEVQHLIQTHRTDPVVAEEQVEQEILEAQTMLEAAELEEVFLQLMALQLTVDHSAAVAVVVHTQVDRADPVEDRELETELQLEIQTEVTLQQ